MLYELLESNKRLTDVTGMDGALGSMNFVSWKRPLLCQFSTIGAL